MFKLRKKKKKLEMNIDVLRRNDISIVILDERWHNLFSNFEKSNELMHVETELKELLKQQGSLNNELSEISAAKKEHMKNIIRLTTEAFDNNNETAKEEMQFLQKEIIRINERIGDIEKELAHIPEDIKKTNLRLLKLAVIEVYLKMKRESDRVCELETLIEKAREELRGYISEKEKIAKDSELVYSYFHDLLGPEELERFDKIFQ